MTNNDNENKKTISTENLKIPLTDDRICCFMIQGGSMYIGTLVDYDDHYFHFENLIGLALTEKHQLAFAPPVYGIQDDTNVTISRSSIPIFYFMNPQIIDKYREQFRKIVLGTYR